MNLCPWKYCGEPFAKAERAQGRVTAKPVFTCPHCRGVVPRHSELVRSSTRSKR